MDSETSLFMLVYLATVPLCYAVIRTVKARISECSIPAFYFWACVMFTHIGLLPLFFEWSGYNLYGLYDRHNLLNLLLYNSTCLFLSVLGIKIASVLLGPPRESRSALRPLSSDAVRFTLLLVACAALIGLAYLRTLPQIALVTALESDVVQAQYLRSVMTNAYEGPVPYHYFAFFMQELMPFLAYLLLAHTALRKGFVCWTQFGVAALLPVLFNAANVQTFPVALFLFGCFLTYRTAAPASRRLLKSGIYLVLAFSTATILYSLSRGAIDSFNTFYEKIIEVVDRVICGGITPAYFYLEMFPGHIGFLYGTSFPNPRGVFSYEVFNITVEMSRVLFPGNLSAGVVGSSPTVYWTELYANFGILGMCLGAPLVGIYLYAIDFWLSRLADSPAKLALRIWAGLHFSCLAITVIGNFIFDTNLLGVVVCAGLIIWLDGTKSTVSHATILVRNGGSGS